MPIILKTAEERRDDWRDGLFAHGDDHEFWDYAQWLHEIFLNALTYVEDLVGAEAAAGPLRALVEPFAQITGLSYAETWQEAASDTLGVGAELPISGRIWLAKLYGFHGVTPKEVPVADRPAWISELVREVTTFAGRPDVKDLAAGRNAIVLIANIAQSRHALDFGDGEVDIGSMAILGGVTEGRVRNLLSGATAQLERGPGGGVLPMSALAWLQRRDGFLQSIWADDEPENGNADDPKGNVAPVSGELMFVPVARDGSMFGPDLARGGQFQIGAKGDERHFPTFDEALAALNEMPVPRWRRPNEHGHWGIVSGTTWQRIARSH
ncbi:hypothetical protein [Falsirhodobacter xinxiangensis]|uniref:hypothetical protein n=1 Tax=Falsirhodobacter xinxiangensis TaxID=2530049 RepID=UPI001C7077EB|nr:hypothetical protein [Rhodobacter xinxiangensis]